MKCEFEGITGMIWGGFQGWTGVWHVERQTPQGAAGAAVSEYLFPALCPPSPGWNGSRAPEKQDGEGSGEESM